MEPTVNQHLKEARSLRDLGFYNDSNRHFDKALSEQPENIPLILEAASTKMSQGLIGDCHAMVSALEARMDRASPGLDPLHLALFDVFFAMSTFTITVKFKEPLRRALEAYTKYGLDRPVESFDKSMVVVASVYHGILSLAKQMCYQPDTPLPSFSAEFQSSLVHYLLSEKRYGDAIKIATLSNFSEESPDNTAMLQAILADEGLSDLQRAEVLWEYGDKVRLAGGGAGWRESLNTAAELYSKAGHASGPLDIRIDLMQHGRNESITTVQDTAELWQIMGTLESVGNWASVNRCLSAIANINTEGLGVPPESLQAKVEEEWLRVTDLCSNNAARVSSSIVKVLEWQSMKSKTAKGLDYLERFYEKIADCDAPAVISIILSTLYDTYKRIGDTAKAEECISRRPEVLPRPLVAVLGIDPFEAALDAATEAPDTEIELKSLRDELQKVRAIIRRTPAVLGRATEVERLSNLCNKYLSQYTFRGYDQLERLVNCIVPVIEEECKSLDDWRASIWKANALQSRALLLNIKSNSSKDTDELLRFTEESTLYYQQAVDVFEASGHSQDWRAGSAKAQLAHNRRLLWQLKRNPVKSDDFSAAATLYAEAAGSGNIDGRQMTCLSLLQLWVEGCHAKVQVDAAVFQPSSPYEMAVKWANEADRLASIQRNDLSALPRERAVLAKQMLSNRDPKQDFHLIALELHDSMDDDLGAWNWLQKSKARSLSDMLALGINIPKALKLLVESDAELVGLCEAEQKLIREINTAPADRLFLLRMKLESHRAEMKQRPVLKQLLDYREGQPTSLERLQNISPRSSPESTRRIFYVDWLVFGGYCFAFIASSTGISSFASGVTSAAIAEWKAKYLGDGFSECHPLDSPDAEPLQKLSKLIQPLLDRTAAGDILVFCPSGVLHGVPLHAATLAEDSKKSLLERNPVVYTASMTTFEQCVSKEAEREQLDRQMSRSYVAVYEMTETGPLSDTQKSLRDDIYAMVRKVAARRQSCSTAFGTEVKRESLVSAFEADYMYFFGHCVSSVASMLLQGLVLDGPAEHEPTSKPAAGAQHEHAHHVFTASDMFAVDIKTSCLTLIACESAKEGHSRGDEPLGIVSALLCAGATSVIGTMWKVQVGTARVFTNALDLNLDDSKMGGGGGVVDLAVAVQQTTLRLKDRRDGQTHHPYHWAAFVLHGSWFMSKRVRAACA